MVLLRHVHKQGKIASTSFHRYDCVGTLTFSSTAAKNQFFANQKKWACPTLVSTAYFNSCVVDTSCAVQGQFDTFLLFQSKDETPHPDLGEYCFVTSGCYDFTPF